MKFLISLQNASKEQNRYGSWGMISYCLIDNPDHYMKENFELYGFNNDRKQSYDNNTLSHFCNGFAGAIRDKPNLPKFIVMVMDNDLIAYFKMRNPELKNGSPEGYERMLKWLMNQFNRLISSHKEYLPLKAKKNPLEPRFLWIIPPQHINFPDNEARENFASSLENAVMYHTSSHALELKKIWDPEDPTLFIKTDKKYSAQGLTSYWNAVDKAVKYVDTLLLKKLEARAKSKSQLAQNTIHLKKEKRKFHEERRNHLHQSSYDCYHWQKSKPHGKRH